MDDLIRGLVVGAALAAPLGPVGLMCIRLALTQGQWPAVAAGLGAAAADAIFGAIGGFGLTLIQQFLTSNETVTGSLGGVILIALGLITLRQRAVFQEEPRGLNGMVRDFATTFALAITNPATFIAALGLFAALGTVNPAHDPAGAALLVAGVFLGSALWWLILARLAVSFRQRMRDNLDWINRLSGGLFLAIGAAVLVGAVT